MTTEATPIVPHQASEFYVWLWWFSEENDGLFPLGADVGDVEVWIDERLAFRSPAETKVTAVMTGDNPSDTLEARAALAGGKVLQELRIGIRREDREYLVTLKGPAIEISRAKLPSLDGANDDGAVFDRMFCYQELAMLVGALFQKFCEARIDASWGGEVVPAVREWTVGKVP